MNAMYCAGRGNRMLPEVTLHPCELTKGQAPVLHRVRKWTEKWLDEDAESIKVTNWEHASEGLRDMYTGGLMGKSYPLTLEWLLS